MSNEEPTGLLVSNENGVYLIPAAQLADFKLSDEEVEKLQGTIDDIEPPEGDEDDVAGFAFEQAVGGRLLTIGSERFMAFGSQAPFVGLAPDSMTIK